MAYFLQQSASRRSFVSGVAKSMLGVGILPWLPKVGHAARPGRNSGGTAQSVIYIYLSGGMSHIDTFDPKPGSETQGPIETLNTSADGVRVSQYFPQMAKQMHHVAVVESMNSTRLKSRMSPKRVLPRRSWTRRRSSRQVAASRR